MGKEYETMLMDPIPYRVTALSDGGLEIEATPEMMEAIEKNVDAFNMILSELLFGVMQAAENALEEIKAENPRIWHLYKRARKERVRKKNKTRLAQLLYKKLS